MEDGKIHKNPILRGLQGWVTISLGGVHLLPGCPPAPPTSKYYYQHRSGGASHQAPGRMICQSQGLSTRHWLEPARRQADSESSLSRTVAGSLDTEQIRRGDERRGEHERVGKGGSGRLIEGNQESICKREFEGGRGGRWGHTENSNMVEIHTGLE